MKKTLLLAGVACLFASQANAEGYFFKPYLGLDYVHSWISETDIGSDAYGEDVKLKEDNMSAGEVSLGVKFHPNFAAEAFYAQSDKIDSTFNGSILTEEDMLVNISGKLEEKYKAFGADFIGSLPVTNGLELLGSLGAGYYKMTGKSEVTSVEGLPIYVDAGSESSNKWGVRVGVGAQYYLTDYLALRGMVRISRIDSFGSLTDLTAGVRVYF